jgi:hypothetical protein
MKIVCVASGNSLTKSDLDYCRDKAQVWVVNDGYKIAPWADLLYAADHDWWDYHDGVKSFKGEKWTCAKESALKYNLNHIDYKPNEIWSNDSDWIATGGNSGFQLVNLADIHGATDIILLGYDMGYTDKKHWFGEHPAKINRGSDYKKWISNFEKARPFIRANVTNCTPYSNLTCFETAKLRDFL